VKRALPTVTIAAGFAMGWNAGTEGGRSEGREMGAGEVTGECGDTGLKERPERASAREMVTSSAQRMRMSWRRRMTRRLIAGVRAAVGKKFSTTMAVGVKGGCVTTQAKWRR
jgi:hypothetical protein